MPKSKVIVPNVVRGGIAIPLKNMTNYYYMLGRSHENGGIDIGKDVEVQGGELVQTTKDAIKVFSDEPFSDPPFNGKSSSRRVLGGENPNKVFNQQEEFKKRHGLNDDGTRKKQYGGDDKPKFNDWYKTVPKEINDTTNYNLRRAYELLPYTELENWKKGKGKVHLRSVAQTENGNYEFLKSKNHPTYKKEIEWYNSPDGESFRKEYFLDESTEYPTYKKRNKKAMGGLSRSKDYGSKSKPYPNVKSKDFAGGNRSYPIPTKADAVDALRLAGLHGRSDVKAKVYSKYPELIKKAKAGGLYSVTVDGKTSLRRFPSTGERTKAAAGAKVDTDNDKDKVIYQPDEYLVEPSRSQWIADRYGEIPFNQIKAYNNINPKPIHGISYAPLVLPSITNPLKDNLSKEKGLYFDRPNWFRRARANTSNYLKNNPEAVNDLIGLTSNITGGLLSHRINRNMLNKLQYVAPPTPRSAVKLKTHININPQLDRMRESLANYERTINDNTTSSNVALARRNQARLANTMQMNELYGNRENAETQLINQDRTNQQNVANENIADYNKWLEGLNAFRNSIIDKKSENNISLVENINSGVQDLINRREKRRSDNQTIAAMTLANPDLPVEMLYAQGLINKNLYDRYMKAYRNRNNKTTTQQG